MQSTEIGVGLPAGESRSLASRARVSPSRLARVSAAIVLGVLFLCGAAARVSVARLGHNWDMNSWQIAADLVAQGKNVYVSTPRYNYGPPWFLVLGGLRWLQERTAATLHVSGPEAFHWYVAGFLSLVDVAIAALLARRAGATAALLFMFFPVGVFISGFHSQFDNVAILLALLAWVILKPAVDTPSSWTRVLVSAVVLGLSLSTKHVMAFFPVWLLMSPAALPRRRAIALTVVAYAVFFASFVPFARAPDATEAIAGHVFQYRSQVGTDALMVRVVDLVVPWNLLERPLKLIGLPLPGGLLILFAARCSSPAASSAAPSRGGGRTSCSGTTRSRWWCFRSPGRSSTWRSRW
jgi:hypothetical protein